jgi:alpha-L-fucosidase
MKVNGEAIYGSKASPFGLFTWGRCTKKGPDSYRDGNNTTLYISVFDWPKDGKLLIPGLTNEITSAKLLANGMVLKTSTTNEAAVINVPERAPDPIATVIRLEVKGHVEPVLAKPNDKVKPAE